MLANECVGGSGGLSILSAMNLDLVDAEHRALVEHLLRQDREYPRLGS